MSVFWCEQRRDAVSVVGPDAMSYLHSQVSNDLRPLEVGQSCWAFLLQPNGRVDVLVRVTRTGDDAVVLDTDAGFGEVLEARVNRFRIRVKADVTRVELVAIAVRNHTGAPVGELVEGPSDAMRVVGWGGGVDLLGEAPSPPAGLDHASAADLLAARVEACWPAMGSEVVPGETIPAETGITSVAVSFTKGCYPGQELVERMDSRGSSAPRLLQVVDVAPGTTPGEALLRDGDTVGTVTSVAGTRAIAAVKRSAIAS